MKHDGRAERWAIYFHRRIPVQAHYRIGGCRLTVRLPSAVFVLLIIAAAVAVIAGVLTGQLGFAVVLIFPVIYGSGPFAIIAVMLIFAAFIVLFLLPFAEHRNFEARYSFDRQTAPQVQAGDQEEGRKNMAATRKGGRFGGVIFIGPVPIIFGTDMKVLRYMFAAAGIMTALILILLLFNII
jgi:uncharacterized protein (TIGR00304 family)